ncbi:MAG: YegS/Rv2252/BmrU family lipid kinase [Bacteroidetes bacterium]|nr:YegS/Rv2252/BmrU family lipid kinase [Bacteroidota bacterium]
MKRKIIYLFNPISGTRKKSSIKSLVARKTREREIEFEILPTAKDGNYDFLRKKIQKEFFTDIVICGGDGTVNQVVSSLKGIKVNIGIIPMGSGNGLAFAAKIPKQPSKALEIIFAGNTCQTDAFFINDQFSCMLCGIGFDALVAHEFAKEKRRGLQTYIKVSAVNFFKAKPYPFEIKLKNKSFRTEAFFICIANSNQFGNNFTIAPQASLGDGLLDVVIVKKMSKLMLPFSLINQVTGINAVQHTTDYFKNKNIIYLQTDSLTIKNLGNAPLHVDGDPGETSEEFKINIIRNCFRLLQPVEVSGE